MGKASRIKSDLDDVTTLVEIIQILKDVAANHFFNTAKRKERFAEFAVAFVEFFRMISLSEADSLLVHSRSDKVGILAITSEGGFMADMTAKVLRRAVQESDKHNLSEFIIIGAKGVEKIRLMTDKPFHGIVDVEEKGLYKTTLEAKRYIIEEVNKGNIGRVYAAYPRAININFIKPVIVQLLPSEELITQQKEVKDTVEQVIVESDVNAIIHYLADMWLTCRLYEMLEDCVIAGFAAQSQQLEASLERMKKDKKGLMMSFKKAQKGDIDKSLREVFTARALTGR